MQPEPHETPLAAAALALLLLAAVAMPVTGLVADGVQEPPPGQSLQTDVETVEADQVNINVDLAADGSAHWTVEYRTQLDDANTTSAWNDFQRDIRENPENYTERFRSRIGSTVTSAENTTGREMALENVTVRAENRSLGTQSTYGVVAYEFTWTNFSTVETDGDGTERLVAGDAIEGFFLAEETTLVVQWPDAFERTSVSPEPADTRSNAVIWTGGTTTFVSGEPALVLERGGGAGASGDGGGIGSPLLLGAVALVVTAIGAALAYRARHDDELSIPAEAEKSRADELREKPASAQNRPDAVRHVDAVPDDGDAGDGAAADADDTADGDGAAGEESDGDDEPTEPPAELLSNEEQVLKFLREAGGRAKQQEVVQGLGWTEAKTSQVVSGMREEGTIDGFRLGRENVLTLPDVDIEVGAGEDGDGDAEDA